MRIVPVFAALAAVLSISTSAVAATDIDDLVATSPPVSVGAFAGVAEYVGTPGVTHYGLYPNAGLYLSVPTDFGSVTPAVGAEYSPEFDLWGPSAMVTADFAQGDGAWGIDVTAMWWVDQPSSAAFLENGATAYYAGLGAGASWFIGDLTLSAGLNLHRGLNAASADWIVFPAAQAGYPLYKF